MWKDTFCVDSVNEMWIKSAEHHNGAGIVIPVGLQGDKCWFVARWFW